MSRLTTSNSALDLDLANRFRMLLHGVRRVLPFEDGGLLLYEPDQRLLAPYVSVGVLHLDHDAHDLARQSMRRHGPAWSGEAGCWRVAVPVIHGETFFGVLMFSACRTDRFSDEQLALLQLLGEQIALELYTLQYVRALKEQHRAELAAQQVELRKLQLLQRIANVGAAPQGKSLDELAAALRETAALLECEGAQLLLPDPQGYQLFVQPATAYGVGAEHTALRWALDGPGAPVDAYHTGEPRVATAGELAGPRFRNALACPLNAHGRTLGVLFLINRQAGSFDADAVEIAQSVAVQIALSAVTGHFLRTEVRRADLMNRVNRVSQELYAILDVQSLLRKLAQRVLDVFEHDAVHILLLTEDRSMLQLRASATISPELDFPPGFSIPAESGVVGRVTKSGHTEIIPDTRSDRDFLRLPELLSVQSALTIPLMRGDQTVGVISVLSTQLNAFSDAERDAMETLVRQISIALENAHLYEQAQRRLLEQSIVYQIGQDLASILDYGELAQAMVEHMNRALNTSSCVVGLYEPHLGGVRIGAAYRDPDHPASLPVLEPGRVLPLAGRPALERAIQTGAPVTVYREHDDSLPGAQALLEQWGVHSQLVLPMVAGERVIGVVDWTDYHPGRVFSQDDLRLAQTLVGQATIAFDNALLFQELERRAQELAQANQIKGQFLATISHELRTPMNSIIGFSEALLNGLYGSLNDAQTSRVQRIHRNARDLLHLIDDLLDLSKIDAGHMTLYPSRVSVSDVVSHVVLGMEAQAQARGLELRVELDPDLPAMCADPKRLQQIITNLLSNAIKFTPEGHVVVSASISPTGNGSGIIITVEDTGIGIDEKDHALIFDEFRQADGSTTRQYGGTGLGLAITRKLVEMMGGTITLQSAPGQGSRFTVHLPLEESAAC